MITRGLGVVGNIAFFLIYFFMAHRGLKWAMGYSINDRPAWYVLIAISLLAMILGMASTEVCKAYFGFILDFKRPKSGFRAKHLLIFLPLVLLMTFFSTGIVPPWENTSLVWGLVAIFCFELIRRWEGPEPEELASDVESAGPGEK